MSSAWYPNTAALSGLVIWYGVFILLDRHGRWRWFRPLLPLFAGAASFRLLGAYLSAIHPGVLPHLEHWTGGNRLALFIIDVGLREELLKLLFTLPCLLLLPSRRSGHRALLTAAMVGLGFATAENRWLFSAHAEPTLLVGRIFSTTLLHAACTGLSGAALVHAWQRFTPRAWARCTATFLTLAAAHGLYDWAPASGQTWLQTGGTSWLSQSVVLVLTAWFFISYRRFTPPGAQPLAAARWFLITAALQHSFALALTWNHWQSSAALWVCSRECISFLPVILATAVALTASAHHPAVKTPEII